MLVESRGIFKGGGGGGKGGGGCIALLLNLGLVVAPSVPLRNGTEVLVGVIEALLVECSVLNVIRLSLSPSGDCNNSASNDKRNKDGCFLVLIDIGFTLGVSVGSINGRRLVVVAVGVVFLL